MSDSTHVKRDERGTADSTTTVTFLIEKGTVTGFEADVNGNKRILEKIP